MDTRRFAVAGAAAATLACLLGQHPPAGIEWFMGDSRATWDGETLVVDVVHFTDQTWCAPFIEAAKNK